MKRSMWLLGAGLALAALPALTPALAQNQAQPGRAQTNTGGAVPGETAPNVRPPPTGPLPTPGQGNLDRLQQFRTTGTSMAIETVAQEGRRADALRRNLEQIRLPEGFKIELFAVVPDARHIAVGPSSGVIFVGTRKQRVWAVTDRDRDRVADEVKVFAPSVQFSVPNGVCFSPDGILYIAEHNRVIAFPAAEFFYETPDVAAEMVVPQGQLIPAAEESFNHGARVCRIGPDNKLYVSLGQPFNVPSPAKQEIFNRVGMGGIIRMERSGQGREVYARGIRNSVGIAFRPGTPAGRPELWFTDNQVDGMGDDTPPASSTASPRPTRISASPGSAAAASAPRNTAAPSRRPRRCRRWSRPRPMPPTSA
ncbi:PQQ-dependent sugar dehydrogenase [Paeniroseomonas aquatica]|uniref:PQQ-dependent sugar dehydrogenase n=1 Tax=Paeniroseomonas aquatica TaxID=373043 RepID=UPI003616B49C